MMYLIQRIPNIVHKIFTMFRQTSPEPLGLEAQFPTHGFVLILKELFSRPEIIISRRDKENMLTIITD